MNAWITEHGSLPDYATMEQWIGQACNQKGAIHSRLAWHTNLDEALAEANNVTSQFSAYTGSLDDPELCQLAWAMFSMRTPGI